MKVLFDTNVVLDVLLARQPWVDDAEALWRSMDDGLLQVVISASSVTDISYIVRKGAGIQAAYDSVRLCLDAFEVGAVDRELLEVAHRRHGRDFEDDLQSALAERLFLDAVVTRDTAGFASSKIAVLTPAQCRQRLGV